ncbi:hypothetical protein BDZ89DRAFT_1048813 [Hymenopellis radicata]|nr:hypothetical protein BDZ89DRAFT_1048813 [Hymenopellis radicata]
MEHPNIGATVVDQLTSKDIRDEPWMLLEWNEQSDEVQLAQQCVDDLKKTRTSLYVISNMRKRWGESARVWQLDDLKAEARSGEELAELLRECRIHITLLQKQLFMSLSLSDNLTGLPLRSASAPLDTSSVRCQENTLEAFQYREDLYFLYANARYPIEEPSAPQVPSLALDAAAYLRIVKAAGRAVQILTPRGLVHFAEVQVRRSLDCPSIAFNLLHNIATYATYLSDTATAASVAIREADPHCAEMDEARAPVARCMVLKLIFDDILDKCGNDSAFPLRLAHARQRGALFYQAGRDVLLAAVGFLRDWFWGLMTAYSANPSFWQDLISIIYFRTPVPPPHTPENHDADSPPASDSLPPTSSRMPFKRAACMTLTLSMLAIFAFSMYAPSERPICKVSWVKRINIFGICVPCATQVSVKDIDPLERHEGWGVSRLSELAGMAHGNMSRVKYDLTSLTSVPFATENGTELLDQARSLDSESYTALVSLEEFVRTIRNELDFTDSLIISYYDVDANTLRLTAKPRNSAPLPSGGAAMDKATTLGNKTRDHLDAIIADVGSAYSNLCVEISHRNSGHLPWKWWYARSTDDLHVLIAARRRFSDALFDLRKTRLGLNMLLTEINLMKGDTERDGVSASVLATKHLLKIASIRLGSLFKTEGEVDFIGMAGETLLGIDQRRRVQKLTLHG